MGITPDTKWQEVFDALNAREQSCIRNELGEESFGRGSGSPVLSEGDAEQWQVSIFQCLDPETAQAIYLSVLNLFLTPDKETETCLRGVLANTDVAAIVAAGLPNPTAENAAIAEEFEGELLTCLENLISPSTEGTAFGPPPLDDSLLWQYGTGTPGELVITASTLADGVVYAGSHEGFVYALDAQTGDLLWRFEADDQLGPPPQVSGGVVLVEDLGKLYALDASTGDLLWSDQSAGAGVVHSPVLSGGTVYMSSAGREDRFGVRAIDAVSGDGLWESGLHRSSSIPLLFPVTASGDNLYVSDESQVHALDSTTGNLAWSFDAGDVVQGPPTAFDGVVYLQSYSAVFAVGESTGELFWSYEVDYGGLPDRPPFVVDGVLLTVGLGVLHALDAATGQHLWTFEEDLAQFVSAVSEGMVFVVGVSAFHALDAATGGKVWSLEDGWGLGEVTVTNGVLYANSLTGYLHTVDATTGEPIWSIRIGYHFGGVDKPFLVSDGVVYVGYQLADSGIYALRVGQGAENTGSSK